CNGDTEGVEDATVSAQKILSCVARVGERFGVGHVVEVLLGSETERIRQLGHDRLSTYGLLRDVPKKTLIGMGYQLLDLGVLSRTDSEYPGLTLNAPSWRVLRGEHNVQLLRTRKAGAKKTKVDSESWEGVDRDLFERLRELRRKLAQDRGVPPYVIF